MRLPFCLLFLLSLAACMPGGGRADRATHIVIAKAFGPASLDPAVAAGAGEAAIEELVYQQLTRLDTTSPVAAPVGELADHWTVSPDGLAISMTLKTGARFSDGTPVNAAAVKASLDRVKRIGRTPSGFLEWLKAVEVTGPLSFRLILIKPYAPAIQMLSQAATSIISPTALRLHDQHDEGQSWLADHSAGSGAYVLAANRPGETVVLTSNPMALAPAAFTTVEFRVLPDEGVRRVLLERGDIDLTDIVPAALIPRYRALSGVAVDTLPGGVSVSYLMLNTAKGPLRDPRLRQAIALAVDYRGLREQVLKGSALQIPGYLTPGSPGFDPAEPAPVRDLQGARRLLKEAHYDGRPLVLLISQLGPVAEFMQANLADAGIKVRLERRSPGALDALQSSGDFDIIYTGWSSDTPDPAPMLDALYSSRGQASGTNGSGFADPLIDSLIDEALRTPSPERRAVLYRKIDARLRAACPVVMIFAANPVVARRDDVGGLVIDRYRPSFIDYSVLTRSAPKAAHQ